MTTQKFTQMWIVIKQKVFVVESNTFTGFAANQELITENIIEWIIMGHLTHSSSIQINDTLHTN